MMALVGAGIQGIQGGGFHRSGAESLPESAGKGSKNVPSAAKRERFSSLGPAPGLFWRHGFRGISPTEPMQLSR